MKLNIEILIEELHKQGLSDLSGHLKVWATFADLRQIIALGNAIESARFKSRYSLIQNLREINK